MLYLLFDYSGFLCILLIGLLVLFRRNNLNSVDLLAAVILLVISLGLLALLYLGMRSAGAFGSALAWIVVSPTPAGIGVVQGSLTLALSSMYIPLRAAAVIALAYRGITFWIPLAYGSVALRILDYRSGI